MTDDEKTLWQREKTRREALWQIENIWPGNVASKETLSVLDDIERQDQIEPLGPAHAMTIEQLRSIVPIVEVRTFRIVRDDDVPEPWRTRFSEASFGSTRIPEGSYVQDWLKFMSGWQREMGHVQNHRDAWLQLDREEERWAIFQQLKELFPGAHAARPLLDRLDTITAEDLPALTLNQVRAAVEPRELGRWKVIPDRSIPRPWNVRFGLWIGSAGRFPEGWFEEDWNEFTNVWASLEQCMEQHRMEREDV